MRKDQSVAKDEVPVGGEGQAIAFADLKDGYGDAMEAVDSAFEEDAETRDRFHRGAIRIGRSVPRLIDRGVNLIPLFQGTDVVGPLTR